MNIENIKSQFPIFSRKINGKPLVYLDSSNSSQKPMCVINRLNDFYKNEFSNIGRSIHSLAVNATNKFEETRISIKNFINAKFKEEIIFTKNATEAINLVATTFGQQNIEKGDEIIITELEHHSNYVPWHFIRQRKGAVIKFAKCNDKGEVEIDEIKKLDVILTEENLSKAIGRRGQNVRLATKLLNYEINIMTDQEDTERRQIEFKEKTDNFVKNLELDETLGQLLVAEGFSSIDDIKDSSIEAFTKIEGIEEKQQKNLLGEQKNFIKKIKRKLQKELKILD